MKAFNIDLMTFECLNAWTEKQLVLKNGLDRGSGDEI